MYGILGFLDYEKTMNDSDKSCPSATVLKFLASLALGLIAIILFIEAMCEAQLLKKQK